VLDELMGLGALAPTEAFGVAREILGGNAANLYGVA